MFCSKCSAENPDDATACSSCGEAIMQSAEHGREEEANASQVTNTSQPTNPPVSMALKVSVSIATLLIPFVGLIMGIIYLKDKTDKSKRSAGALWLSIAIISAIVNVIFMTGSGPQ